MQMAETACEPLEQNERHWPPDNDRSSRGKKRPATWVEGRAAKVAFSPACGQVFSCGVPPARTVCGQLLSEPAPPFVVDPVTGGPMRPGPEIEFDPQGAPVPSNEEFRLQVLRSYNILNTEPEPRYDRLTALAASVFHTPVALVSLVDEDRQWFKSNTGLPGCTETKRTGSFCTYAILPAVEPVLVVCDALKDGRFCKNALVVGEPYIRFYAGAPLITEGNFCLGSLCIIDFKPRESFSSEEQELLLSLAQLVVQEMEKHTRFLELQRLQAERFEDDKRGLLRAIDAFSEGLVLCDVSQKGQPIVFVNEGWEKLTGYSIKDVMGSHCGSLLQGPLTDRDAQQTLAKAFSEGESASVEILNYRKDGTPFWNWLRVRPAVFPTGTAFASDSAVGSRYYFGILSDCTLRKEKEQRLEAIRLRELEAEASTRAKRSFVANISHEIRTPMNAILACSQLLTDMGSLTGEQRELSQMIQGSGQQLLSLINDILDFSKLESGKLALKAAEFNLWGCIDFCVEMLVLKCEHKGLHLSYNMDSSVPDWIWADEVRVRQILTNLLSNAAKFTDQGGEVEVSVTAKRVFRSLSGRGSPDGPLSPRWGGSSSSGSGGEFPPSAYGAPSPRFGAASPRFGTSEAPGEGPGECPEGLPEYRITIAVRDTGIGIPAEFQKRLFDAFTQCDNSRTRLYEGTGLGLAISRDLAERMGGTMWVDSEEGVGSTFFVTLTARGSMQPSTGRSLSWDQALHRPVTPISGRRALLVGARDTFHRMVGSMLRAWGVDVTVAASESELSALAGGSGGKATGSRPPGEGRSDSQDRQAAGSGPRVDVSSHGFDVFIVDSPVAWRCCEEQTAGTPCGVSRAVAEPQKRAIGAPGEEYRAAVGLMRRACTLGRGKPTVLLASKSAKRGFDLEPDDRDRVICLSQPVRINPFYAALLQALAPGRPPALLPSPTALPAVVGKPSPGDLSLQITIVEDNPVNQRVLQKMLKALGYAEIRTAFNGVEVLRQIKQHIPDVILMDIHMPEMDGLTATTRIKAYLSEEQQPLIIALTADVGNDIEKECQETGMVAYLSKPVQKVQLQKMLSKCVHYKKHPEQRKALKWIDV